MARPGRTLDALFYALLAVTAVTVIGELYFIFLVAPIEARMGIVQKIFYFHVPSWYAMYLGAGACFLGSLAYLVRATDARDAFARAGAEVAVVFGAIGLITGPLWGAKAWGSFWTCDPRLTTALLSFLIYVAYLVLRAFAGEGTSEKRFSAALGVLGAFAVFDGQRFLPICPIAVFEAHRDGRSDGFSVAHARENVRLVLLDALAAAAPESQLAPVEFAADEVHIHGNPRRKPGYPGDQRLPVRFSSGDKSQHVQLSLALRDKRKILPDVWPGVKAMGPKGVKMVRRLGRTCCQGRYRARFPGPNGQKGVRERTGRFVATGIGQGAYV